jgi:2-polyprenyl-3-methyl-5-hydroxy-6-metoxy-1,4-benzoquinol methylase
VAATERAGRIEALGYDYAGRAQERVESCNLCGSAHHVEVSRRDRYGYPAIFRVCARCGLGFLSPRLTAEEYGRFYEDVYRPLVSAYHGRTIDAQTLPDEQRAYGAELTAFLREFLPAAPASVIDLGGSTGVVGGVVRDAFGSEVTVLDPAPDELAVAEAAGMETVAGFIEDYDAGGRTWDLVLLCQTLDHVLDATAVVDAVRAMTAPDGHAFVDVLDVSFMARRRGSIEGAVKIDHPYYFTRDTALAYFARAGLEPVAQRMSDDGHWGFLLRSGDPREPDWAGLEAAADAFLAEVWALRA